MARTKDLRLAPVLLFVAAVTVLVAGVWWAFAMPPHYVVPADLPPVRENDVGTRVAVGVLSGAFSAVLAVIGWSRHTKGSRGKPPRNGEGRISR